MNDDMKDKELTHWTLRGENTAGKILFFFMMLSLRKTVPFNNNTLHYTLFSGYFVAEVDGEVVGTVAYEIQVNIAPKWGKISLISAGLWSRPILTRLRPQSRLFFPEPDSLSLNVIIIFMG